MNVNPYEPPASEPARPPVREPRGRGPRSAALAAAGSTLLLLAASHARVDRTNRQPVVSWVGPLADWVVYLAALGWFLTFLAGTLVFDREGRPSRWGLLGLFLVIANLFGTCLFLGFIGED